MKSVQHRVHRHAVETSDHRKHPRVKVAILARAQGRKAGVQIQCIIRDASITGCKIIGRHIPDLPDLVSIIIPKFKQAVDGRIVWRQKNTAGVKFLWHSFSGDPRHLGLRSNLSIPAMLCDKNNREMCKVTITDANHDSCRIQIGAAQIIPDLIHIAIPNLTGPIKAKLVWRDADSAGLDLIWTKKFFLLEI